MTPLTLRTIDKTLNQNGVPQAVTQVNDDKKKSAPKVFTDGFSDSIDLPGLPRLSADVDHAVFKSLSLPTLLAVTQTSKSSNVSANKFLASPGEPGGANDILRRKRFELALAKEAQERSDRNRCDLLITEAKSDAARLRTEIDFDALAEKFAAENLSSISQWITNPELEHLPALVRASTAGAAWKNLVVDLSKMQRGRFIDQGAAILKSIQYGAGEQRVTLYLGQHFSDDDAHALLGYLRATPQCKAIEFVYRLDAFDGFDTLLTGLAATEVNEVKILAMLSEAQQNMVGDFLANPKLEKFSVTTELGDQGEQNLGAAIRNNTGLKYLMLAANDMSEAGAITIADAIASHPKLEALYFSNNDIGKQAWGALGNAIAKNPTLCDVVISDSQYGLGTMREEDFLAFLSPLTNCNKFLRLHVSACLLTPAAVSLLKQLLINNPVLCRLGKFRRLDQDQAYDLIEVLQVASGPITVDCTLGNKAEKLIAEAGEKNPLLKFDILRV